MLKLVLLVGNAINGHVDSGFAVSSLGLLEKVCSHVSVPSTPKYRDDGGFHSICAATDVDTRQEHQHAGRPSQNSTDGSEGRPFTIHAGPFNRSQGSRAIPRTD